MTVKELYASDSNIQAFLKLWNEYRECPIPFVDYLIELGLDSQAEVARWCTQQKIRSVLLPQPYENPTSCRCYPTKAISYQYWYFHTHKSLENAYCISWGGGAIKGETPIEAIVNLLDSKVT